VRLNKGERSSSPSEESRQGKVRSRTLPKKVRKLFLQGQGKKKSARNQKVRGVLLCNSERKKNLPMPIKGGEGKKRSKEEKPSDPYTGKEKKKRTFNISSLYRKKRGKTKIGGDKGYGKTSSSRQREGVLYI